MKKISKMMARKNFLVFLFEISYCQISGKVNLKNVKLTNDGW